MKRIIPVLFCAAILLCSGCNKLIKDLIDDTATKDVDVTNIDFESEEIEVFPAPEGSPEGVFHDFLEEQFVDLNELEGADELKKYDKRHIKSVTVDSASLVVYAVSNKAGDVKDFNVTIDEPSDLVLKVGEYQLGSTLRTEEVRLYIEKLIFEVLTKEKVTLTLKGQTNLPESEKLKLKLTIKGIRVKVQLS
jgi:hypothetical protein